MGGGGGIVEVNEDRHVAIEGASAGGIDGGICCGDNASKSINDGGIDGGGGGGGAVCGFNVDAETVVVNDSGNTGGLDGGGTVGGDASSEAGSNGIDDGGGVGGMPPLMTASQSPVIWLLAPVTSDNNCFNFNNWNGGIGGGGGGIDDGVTVGTDGKYDSNRDAETVVVNDSGNTGGLDGGGTVGVDSSRDAESNGIDDGGGLDGGGTVGGDASSEAGSNGIDDGGGVGGMPQLTAASQSSAVWLLAAEDVTSENNCSNNCVNLLGFCVSASCFRFGSPSIASPGSSTFIGCNWFTAGCVHSSCELSFVSSSVHIGTHNASVRDTGTAINLV